MKYFETERSFKELFQDFGFRYMNVDKWSETAPQDFNKDVKQNKTK